MTWIDTAAELKFDKKTPWTKMVQAMQEQGYNLTYDAIRNALRRHPRYKENEQFIDITESVLKLIERPIKIDELSQKLNISKRITIATIEDLKEAGFTIEIIGDLVALYKAVIPQENVYKVDWNGDQIIKFGVVSDPHLCNKWQQKTFLKQTYKRFKNEGISKVYLPGDISDGYYKNRPGHIFELIPGRIGVDEQADYITQEYPYEEGIETFFITGNHDHTHIINGGADIGKRIAKERPDMKYLGQANAVVELTPNCKMELNHPLDGTAYALSYSIQKYIESYTGGEKPNILLNGHHHKAMYVFYRNVHGFECGTCEDQTPWMKGKRLAAHMGAWIIQVHVNSEGTINKCAGEFIPLYTPIKDDY